MIMTSVVKRIIFEVELAIPSSAKSAELYFATKAIMERRTAYSSICCQLVLPPCQIPAPPHEQLPHLFMQSTPHYRLNLLVTDDSGDTLYFAYSSTHIARYRIRRCNGIQLQSLRATPIKPPTVVNNMRLANFADHRGGRVIVMTGGSELAGERGTLSLLPLPWVRKNSAEHMKFQYHHQHRHRHQHQHRTRKRRKRNINQMRTNNNRISNYPGTAITFPLPVISAWGLAVHNETCRIAISSNSHSVFLLSITKSHSYVNDGNGASNTVNNNDSNNNNHENNTNDNGNDNNDDNNIIENMYESNSSFSHEQNENEESDLEDEYVDDYDQHQSGGELIADEDDANGRFARFFRLVPLTETLDGTHKNNVPCVAFNRQGDRLASASIDTTFAVYDLSESSEPMDMIMDLFVPRVSGRTLYQSGRPVRATEDVLRNKQRAWAVHWTERKNLPEVTTASHVGRCILGRFQSQHEEGVWLPDDGIGLGVDLHDDDDRQQQIFSHVYQSNYPDPNKSPSDIVLYDDSNEEPLDLHFFDEYNENDVGIETDIIDNDSNHMEKIEKGFVFYPEPGGEQLTKKAAGWRKQLRGGERKRDDGYLLVGLEESLLLYSVNNNSEEMNNENEAKEPDVVLLDKLNVCSMGLRGQPQKMFTNVIEIEKLKAFVVTGVGGGVFLVRIIEIEVNGNEESDESDSKDRRLGARLFIERVFMMEDNVIGTCIVERESECRSLRSFELWILQQNGVIQCWDLSEQHTPFDVSDVI